MRSLALVLILCALLPLLYAFCYVKPDLTAGMTHCLDEKDKTWHAVGSQWRNSDCMDCTCNSCCSGYSTPISFPDECKKEWDQKACEFKVVKKSNPSISCPIFSAVG